MSKAYVGYIGKLSDKILFKKASDPDKKHLVYVSSYDPKNKTVGVNIITSLEKPKEGRLQYRIDRIRTGNIIAVPVTEADFYNWSSVSRHTFTKNRSNAKKLNINDIDFQFGRSRPPHIKRRFQKVIKRFITKKSLIRG